MFDAFRYKEERKNKKGNVISDIEALQKLFGNIIYEPANFAILVKHKIFAFDIINFENDPALFRVQNEYFLCQDSHFVGNAMISNLNKFVDKVILKISINSNRFNIPNSKFSGMKFSFYLSSIDPEIYRKHFLKYAKLNVYTMYKGEKIYTTVLMLINNDETTLKLASKCCSLAQLPQYYIIEDGDLITVSEDEFYIIKQVPFEDVILFDIKDLNAKPPMLETYMPGYWLGKRVADSEDGSTLYEQATLKNIIVEDGMVFKKHSDLVISTSGDMARIVYRTSCDAESNHFKAISKKIPIIKVTDNYYPEYEKEWSRTFSYAVLKSLVYIKEGKNNKEDKNA